MTAPTEYDVAVIGLGALGSAAAWQLARRGSRVIGLDRFGLGHTRGASHGESRIIRLSYHTPSYVRSAAAAFDAYAELSADAGEQLVTECGGADVFPAGAAIDVRDYVGSLDAVGVPFDLLDAGAARARWPGLAVPADGIVLHQARTGIVAAGRTVAALHRQARAHGADLRDNCAVSGIHEDGTGVVVATAGGDRYRVGSVVLATDGWTNELLAGDGDGIGSGALGPAGLPLTTTEEYVVHFAVEPGSHAPGRFPVWIWMDDPSYYGFPSFGEASVKVGQDCGGEPIDPSAPPTRDEKYLARLTEFVRSTVPGAGSAIRVTRCLYTLTPDRDFVLGPLPGHDRVLVALGAAHGFKFAPWFGAALADLARDGGTELEIAGFAADRPGLTAGSGERRWLS